MPRAARIEFPGALHHVTARGAAGVAIFAADDDKRRFLELLTEVTDRFAWTCHAWCLLEDRYALLIETAEANLGRGMRQLNGVFTQRFNRVHGHAGSVLRDRYKAVLVDREAHLLEIARHVVLAPLRAGVATAAGDWPWSSYRATAGLKGARAIGSDPAAADAILRRFGTGDEPARTAYRRFVRAGTRQRKDPLKGLKSGPVIGDAAFLAALQARRDTGDGPGSPHRNGRPPIDALRGETVERGAWMTLAHDRHGYTLAEIGAAAGLHYSSVSKIVRRWRERRAAGETS